MDYALLVARLVLAGTFLVAGLAKLADRAAAVRSIIEFGVPARLATPLGRLLPLAELAVACTLLFAATVWWGALGALALLLLFIVAISVNLGRGRKVDCHCFGQLSSRPAGWRTLVRNVALAAAAGLLIWQGPRHAVPGAFGGLGSPQAGTLVTLAFGILVLALLLAEGWLLLHLLSQNGRLLARVEALEARQGIGAASPASRQAPAAPGLPIGVPAPAFSLPGLHGEMSSLDALLAAMKPVLLLFSDPGCGPCNALLPEVARWQREYHAAVTIVPISRGDVAINRAKNAEHGLTHMLLQQDREVAQAYQAYGTPGAVIVRPDGAIGSPLALGADAIRDLVVRTAGLPASAPPSAGDPGKHGGDCACARRNGSVQRDLLHTQAVG